MVEVHHCDECGKEMTNRLEVRSIEKDKEYGIDLPYGTAEVCSVRCAESWANRMRRFVFSAREGNNVIYHSTELGKVGCWEVHWEVHWGLHKNKITLCVKPEVWKQKMGIC